MGIPWSKRLVSCSLDEPLLIPSRLFHQYKRRTRLMLCWFSPHNTTLPYKSSVKNAIIAARELAYALKNPSPQEPFSNICESQLVAIDQLSKIFTKAAEDVKSTANLPQQQAEQTTAVIPQTLQPGQTKYILSLQTNVIEDEEGKEPKTFQHNVHRSPSGPHIIPP